MQKIAIAMGLVLDGLTRHDPTTGEAMAMTLAEKIIARACGRISVQPGEIVTAKVDLAMIHDSGGPRRVEPILKRLGVGLFDRSKVVLISDHFVPGDDVITVSPWAEEALRDGVHSASLR